MESDAINCLDFLPTETWTRIVLFVSLKKDVLSFATVCREFNDIVKYLFEHNLFASSISYLWKDVNNDLKDVRSDSSSRTWKSVVLTELEQTSFCDPFYGLKISWKPKGLEFASLLGKYTLLPYQRDPQSHCHFYPKLKKIVIHEPQSNALIDYKDVSNIVITTFPKLVEDMITECNKCFQCYSLEGIPSDSVHWGIAESTVFLDEWKTIFWNAPNTINTPVLMKKVQKNKRIATFKYPLINLKAGNSLFFPIKKAQVFTIDCQTGMCCIFYTDKVVFSKPFSPLLRKVTSKNDFLLFDGGHQHYCLRTSEGWFKIELKNFTMKNISTDLTCFPVYCPFNDVYYYIK